MVLVVLYGVGTKLIRKVGAGWRIDLIDSIATAHERESVQPGVTGREFRGEGQSGCHRFTSVMLTTMTSNSRL